ncbi:hypothetical protein GWN63_04825 [Candidatus Bathyarchaeota archaeon]|nr:hypothetical protein [Candidatus Bathyarchaeota archaeon]NIU81549.1 hypothetical protein [Candidatus Bathyarchaeota archaeon]NIV67663.1 hypothetical protein [Candidatus Bathyarchaeota archaeon]NIW16571.1 hypothetical protein [Candidatus Bathyarchaeota archaeon]NIW34711.1 hypothetical protein [Candidatus Bathyarchaeota archaeon]
MRGEKGNRIPSKGRDYRSKLDDAEGYGKVWEIVKDTVKDHLGEYRAAMMLFLDDLPLRLGAYHPLGTNNIVLNRRLVQTVEVATDSKRLLNAFVYVLLLHEYLHALGYVQESRVRRLVYQVSRASFGDRHIVPRLAKAGPWSLLKKIPLKAVEAPKRLMEIVKGFERTDQDYIA